MRYDFFTRFIVQLLYGKKRFLLISTIKLFGIEYGRKDAVAAMIISNIPIKCRRLPWTKKSTSIFSRAFILYLYTKPIATKHESPSSWKLPCLQTVMKAKSTIF
jgi:hypothetical protein